MSARCSATDLGWWQAFDRLSPIGGERSDALNAIHANVTARCAGNKTRPADFLPPWVEREDETQSPEEMLAILKRMAGKSK